VRGQKTEKGGGSNSKLLPNLIKLLGRGEKKKLIRRQRAEKPDPRINCVANGPFNNRTSKDSVPPRKPEFKQPRRRQVGKLSLVVSVGPSKGSASVYRKKREKGVKRIREKKAQLEIKHTLLSK